LRPRVVKVVEIFSVYLSEKSTHEENACATFVRYRDIEIMKKRSFLKQAIIHSAKGKITYLFPTSR
jgi:hypothetical protein